MTEPQVLSQDMHQTLMQVFDDAVIIALNMQVDVGQVRRSPAGETGKGNDRQRIVFRPLGRADDIFRIPGRRNGQQYVPRFGQGLELIDEHVVVADVVGDGGNHFDIAGKRDHLGPEVGIRLAAFRVVADQMVGDRRRPPVAANIQSRAPLIGFIQQREGGLQRIRIHRRLRRLNLLEVGGRVSRDVG